MVSELGSLGAEAYIIGACLHNNSYISYCQGVLKRKHWYGIDYGKVFSIMVKSFNDGNEISVQTLYRGCKDVGMQITPKFIAACSTSAEHVTDKLVQEHAMIIIDYYRRRLVEGFLTTTGKSMTTGEGNIEEHLNEMRDLLKKVDEANARNDHMTPEELMEKILERAKQQERGGNIEGMIKTGIKQIDEHTMGLMGGEMMVIGARPSVGKTEVGCVSTYYNVDQNIPVLFITLEMQEDALFSRLLKYKYDLSGSNLRTGRINERAKGVLENDKEAVKWPVYIRKMSDVDVIDVRTEIRKYVLKYGVKLVIVDYLGLIKDRRGKKGEEAMSDKSNNIKQAALENDIPIILLAQLSRKTDDRKYAEPEMGDLKGSGAIEADADVVYLLWRPEMAGATKIGDVDVTNKMKLKNPKFRGGDKKSFYVDFEDGQIKGIGNDLPF